MSVRVALGAALVLVSMALGCRDAGPQTQSASNAPDHAQRRSDGASTPETRRKAPVTPAIVAASERLLAEHGDAPIGSEFPLTVGGKRYIGRIEEHENTEGDPTRPAGKHKGVTVYEQ
jgi:hypothetical protein